MNAMLLGLSLIFVLLPLYVVSAPFLIITTSDFVYRMNLDGTDPKPVLPLPPGGRDVDYHFGRTKLYWGHARAGSAGRANLDGTDRANVPTLRSELAVDWQQDKIYYSTPHGLSVFDIASGMDDPLPAVPPGTYYDLSVYPKRRKLYSVDGQLYVYDLGTQSLQPPRSLACPARHLSHIENRKLFYSCPSDGVYRLDLDTFNSDPIYDDADRRPFGDVTSYMNDDQVFWAREGCIYSKKVSGGPVTQLPHCFTREIVKGLTVVHPSLQP